MPDDVEIRELRSVSPGLCSALVDLLERGLGRNAVSRRSVLEAASDDHHQLLVACRPGSSAVLGVSLAGRLGADRSYYAPFGSADFHAYDSAPLGSILAASVADESRGQGIGRRLFEGHQRWMQAAGMDACVAIAWLSGGEHQSLPLLRRMGFRELARAAAFYRADSQHHGLRCPTCGETCSCDAALCLRVFDDPAEG